MTDDELSRLLDEYADAALTRRSIPIRFKAARAAILSHFDRRKEGEGGEDAERRYRALDQAVNDACTPSWHHKMNERQILIAETKETTGKWIRLREQEIYTVAKALADAARTEGKGNG